MSRRFQRMVEDFVCAHCGYKVTGTGYTNHCPRCLWSKHVDINPGDRLAICEGLMKPLAVEGKPGVFRILHSCQICGFETWNKASKEDNFERLVELAENNARRTLGY